MLAICLLVLLLLLGFFTYPSGGPGSVRRLPQPYQKPGQSTTTTREEQVQPDGTKRSKETTRPNLKGQRYRYSGLPGKFIKSGGQSRGQGQLMAEREPRRHYSFEFATRGTPKGSDPTEAYWFERQDGTSCWLTRV